MAEDAPRWWWSGKRRLAWQQARQQQQRHRTDRPERPGSAG